jgi:hypothetical protein
LWIGPADTSSVRPGRSWLCQVWTPLPPVGFEAGQHVEHLRLRVGGELVRDGGAVGYGPTAAVGREEAGLRAAPGQRDPLVRRDARGGAGIRRAGPAGATVAGSMLCAQTPSWPVALLYQATPSRPALASTASVGS